MTRTIPFFLTLCALTACSAETDSNRVVGELTSVRIELTFEFSEPITDIIVTEGETVTTGQALISQNSARARARLAETDAAYLQGKARLDELVRGPRSELIAAARANLNGAVQELDFRNSEQSRFAEIHQRGLTSTETLDKANAARDSADADFELRQAQLEELLAGTTLEELSQAEQSVKRFSAQRDSAQIDVDRHTLRAPADGVIDSRLFELGERPAIGQPVLILLAGEQPYARVYVSEELRARVHSGTKARIYVDGLEMPVAGVVRVIATEPAFTPYYALTERDRGRLSYVAKVDIAEVRERLPDGVPVEVEFLLD